MHILALSISRNILQSESRERSRMRLYARHLANFHIVVLTRKEHGFQHVIHEQNMHVYPTNSFSRIMMLVDAFRIGKSILRTCPKDETVVTAQDPLEIGWVAFLLSRVTSVAFHVQIHGDYFSSEGWIQNSVLQKVRRFFALQLLLKSSAIRVVSNRIKDSLVLRGVSVEKITVLPIRPELETFLKTEHVFREHPPYTLLYLGRFASEKNIQRIISAFAEVLQTYPDTKLHIVGEGRQQESLISLTKVLGINNAVSFFPWTEDVAQTMAEADVFLLASKHEAYALTLVEAMAVGLPLVTSDVGCVGEVVRDGVHGIVVREEGTSAYARAIVELLRDRERRNEYGENGKKTAQKIADVSEEEYVQAWVRSVSQAL